MLNNLWKKFVNWRDEKSLAKYAARDAELGTPTKETLNERAIAAAEKGHWKTALAAVEAGADVNVPIKFKQFYGTRGGGLKFNDDYSLAHLAARQNNAGALQSLIEKGANTGFIATYRVNEREYKYSLAEYAALNGAMQALDVVLEKGNPKQEQLEGALKIAAGEPAYLLMTEVLLKKGARDFEGALRAAEKRENKKGILLLRRVQKKVANADLPLMPLPPNSLADYEHVKATFGRSATQAEIPAPKPGARPQPGYMP